MIDKGGEPAAVYFFIEFEAHLFTAQRDRKKVA